MKDQTEKSTPPLDTSTRLAYDRTRLACERTMLAWVRTATALITFGFSFYTFFQIQLNLDSEIELQYRLISCGIFYRGIELRRSWRRPM